MDLQFETHGSIVLLRPVSKAAVEWIDEWIGDEAPRWGGAVACEVRYAEAIWYGAQDDGLRVVWIDGGSREAKKARLPGEVFEARLRACLAGLGLIED